MRLGVGGKNRLLVPLLVLLVDDSRLDLLLGLADALAVLGNSSLRVGVAELSLDDGEVLLQVKEAE
jgi:hypothetical protein